MKRILLTITFVTSCFYLNTDAMRFGPLEPHQSSVELAKKPKNSFLQEPNDTLANPIYIVAPEPQGLTAQGRFAKICALALAMRNLVVLDESQQQEPDKKIMEHLAAIGDIYTLKGEIDLDPVFTILETKGVFSTSDIQPTIDKYEKLATSDEDCEHAVWELHKRYLRKSLKETVSKAIALQQLPGQPKQELQQITRTVMVRQNYKAIYPQLIALFQQAQRANDDYEEIKDGKSIYCKVTADLPPLLKAKVRKDLDWK